jgi:hypothetical protein
MFHGAYSSFAHRKNLPGTNTVTYFAQMTGIKEKSFFILTNEGSADQEIIMPFEGNLILLMNVVLLRQAQHLYQGILQQLQSAQFDKTKEW